MKIKSISPVCVHIPTRIGNELYQYNFIKIQTEEGMVGWGEAFGYISWKPVKVAIEEMIIPFLKGKEINTVKDILKISNENYDVLRNAIEQEYEKEDTTKGTQEFSCVGDFCEVVDV